MNLQTIFGFISHFGTKIPLVLTSNDTKKGKNWKFYTFIQSMSRYEILQDHRKNIWITIVKYY